jgi:EAL domain-containing protein (putative c-di-GMP-specific phosphodiesterase class I)
MAEETGLIIQLGEYVLRQACTQMARWTTDYHPGIGISVNVSARQFETDLFDVVTRALEESGMNPRMLVLELTETMLMRDTKQAAATLAKLQALGVKVAVDDFGTGYSSLAYLEEFSVDVIKVDRDLVSGPNRPNDQLTMADAVIRLGHSLGLIVVAEGVEEPWQADHLRRSGCDFAQGFLYSRPLLADDMEEVLRRSVTSPLR